MWPCAQGQLPSVHQAAIVFCRLPSALSMMATLRVTFLTLLIIQVAHFGKTSDHSMSPLFRLGSGAVVAQTTASIHPADASLNYQEKPVLPRVPLRRVLLIGLPLFFSAALLIMMMPAGGSSYSGNSRDFNYRIPPSWIR